MEEELVKLTINEQAVALKSLKDMHFVISQLHEKVEKGKLSTKMAETLTQLVEFHMTDLSKIITVETISAKKNEEKFSELRKANERIQELERMIGTSYSVEVLPEQLRTLSNLLVKWWEVEGFKSISEITYNRMARLEATLHFSFSKMTDMFSDTPVSDKQARIQWIEGLINKGYRLFYKDDYRGLEMIDCDENKTRIMELLVKQLPSVKILEWRAEKNYQTEDPLFTIREVKIVIENLKEVRELEEYLKMYDTN